MQSNVKFKRWFTRKRDARREANRRGVCYWRWRSERENKKLGINIAIHGWYVGDSPRASRKARKMDATWDGPYYKGHEDTRLPIVIFMEEYKKRKEAEKRYMLDPGIDFHHL